MKKFNEISKEDVGNMLTIDAQVTNIVQTKGPTIFKVTDGHSNYSVKSFKAPGVRANPEVSVDDVFEITFKVTEFNNNLEGEANAFRKKENQEEAKQTIRDNRKSLSQIGDFSFLVESPTTDKMKDRFAAAAQEIKHAIADDRMIVIRHHNDCDGYSAGVVLERAILPLLEKRHGMDTYKFFIRSVSRAPFYEYEDSLRDAVMSTNNQAKFGQKPPLVLIVDNGSGPEDVLGIKQGKVFGMDFIVIDHHTFGEKDLVSDEVLVHINPHLVGEDYNFTAGMLCTELANILNPNVENFVFIAGMSGIADMTNSSALDQFLALAEKEGYSKQRLTEMGIVVDFVARMLRNMEGRALVQTMFGADRDKQQALVDLLYPTIMEKYARNLALAKEFGVREEYGELTVQWLDIEGTLVRDMYPPAGKTTGLYHDAAKQEKTRVVTFGQMSDAFTIRATEEAGFSVHSLMAFLKEKYPMALLDGGGHDCAGSIRFVPNAKQQIIEATKEYLKTIQ